MTAEATFVQGVVTAITFMAVSAVSLLVGCRYTLDKIKRKNIVTKKGTYSFAPLNRAIDQEE